MIEYTGAMILHLFYHCNMKINGKGGMSRTEGDEEYREVLFGDLFMEKGKRWQKHMVADGGFENLQSIFSKVYVIVLFCLIFCYIIVLIMTPWQGNVNIS